MPPFGLAMFQGHDRRRAGPRHRSGDAGECLLLRRRTLATRERGPHQTLSGVGSSPMRTQAHSHGSLTAARPRLPSCAAASIPGLVLPGACAARGGPRRRRVGELAHPTGRPPLLRLGDREGMPGLRCERRTAGASPCWQIVEQGRGGRGSGVLRRRRSGGSLLTAANVHPESAPRGASQEPQMTLLRGFSQGYLLTRNEGVSGSNPLVGFPW